MNRSESIVKLAVALNKFHSEIETISKDAVNPHFRNKFASLDALISNTKPILAKYGISVMQFPVEREGMVGVTTLLVHETGEFMESEPFYLKPSKADPQGYGSAITYSRRYSYQAILNLNMEDDDDGNNATFGDSKPQQSKGNLSENQIKRLYAIGNKAGIAPAVILKVCIEDFNVKKVEDLTKPQYDQICSRLESKIK